MHPQPGPRRAWTGRQRQIGERGIGGAKYAMPYTLTVSETFDAAHHLPKHRGACARVHGHTWRVEADWVFGMLGDDGMAEDFADLKARVRDVLPDHQDLNEVFDFTPTAENLARHFCETLQAHAVRVWESEGSCASYTSG